MKLHVVRHGIAVDRADPTVKSDEERWLTEEGKQRTREAAEGLRALGVEVDQIFSSPLVRARETAEILQDVLRPKSKLILTEALEPGFTLPDLCEALMEEGPPERAMIVGHEPDLSEMVSTLIWGDDRGEVAMKKAGVALIDLPSLPPGDGATVLEWLIPPKVLRSVKS